MREPSFESDGVPEERPLRWPEPQSYRPAPRVPRSEPWHPLACLGVCLGVIGLFWIGVYEASLVLVDMWLP